MIICYVRLYHVIKYNNGGDTLVVEHRGSDRKGAGHRFDSRTCNASLCPWERHFMLISHWGQAVHLLRWPSLTKDLQTEP